MDYWNECIAEAFEDAGITATSDQIDTVASWVEGAHENYRTAMGYDAIPNPQSLEVDKLERELKREREMVHCKTCNGTGRVVEHGPIHSADMTCWKCNGNGKHHFSA